MRTIILFICFYIFSAYQVFTQPNQVIIVKAGTKVVDYFPPNIRYQYEAFSTGKVYFLNGSISEGLMNYNMLNGEIEFIDSKHDTLVLVNKNSIKYVQIEDDIFYYDGIFLHLISDRSSIIVAQKHFFEYLGAEKHGAYGMSQTTSAIDSYASLQSGGTSFDLIVAEDLKFRETTDYYFSLNGKEFFPYYKRNVKKLFPKHKKDIKSFIKASDIDFNQKEDLLMLADYLGSLSSIKNN